MFKLGMVELLRESDGSIGIGQHWNPMLIPREDREAIAETLREIAAHVDRDQFENAGKYRFFKSPTAEASR